MLRLVILTAVFIHLLPPGHAQVYSWNIDSLYSTSKRDIKVYEKLKKTGLRYNEKQLEITNIEAWKPFLKSKNNMIVVGEQQYTSEHLLASIIAQYASSHNDAETKTFEKYLKNLSNKRLFGKPFRSTQYQREIFVIDTFDNSGDLDIGIYSRQKLTTITLSSHKINWPDSLKVFENNPCEPFYRSMYYTAIDDQISHLQYRNYRPRPAENFKHSYTLYFDKNSTAYQWSEIQEIIDFLNQERLSINHAEINAFSSVEGDSINNAKLHTKRAAVLMQTLEQFHDEDMTIDINMQENWSKYREQLHEIEDHLWDELGKSEIKALLRNDSIEEAHEPYLQVQRKAEMQLTLTRRLTNEQQIESIERDYKKFIKLFYVLKMNSYANYQNKIVLNKKLQYCLSQLMSIKLYAIKMLSRDKLQYEDVRSLWDDVYYKEEILGDFYTMRKAFREGNTMNNVPIETILLNAYREFLGMWKANAINTKDPNFQRSLLILNETMNLIKREKLAPEFIFKLEYPEAVSHAHLKAAQNDFVIRYNIKKPEERNGDIGPEPFSLSWMQSDKGKAHYQLIKNIAGVSFKPYLGEERMYINPRHDVFYQFDLLEFLIFNVNIWNPKSSELYDPEITPNNMHRLLKTLFEIDKKLCPKQLYALAIQFHQKYLIFSLNQEVTNRTWYSYDFIRNYYLSKADLLSHRQAEEISSLLLRFNEKDFFNRPYADAIKLRKMSSSTGRLVTN
ncbi:MAG: hypothetical protein ABJH05_04485 [Fulvivirga sp.]